MAQKENRPKPIENKKDEPPFLLAVQPPVVVFPYRKQGEKTSTEIYVTNTTRHRQIVKLWGNLSLYGDEVHIVESGDMLTAKIRYENKKPLNYYKDKQLALTVFHYRVSKSDDRDIRAWKKYVKVVKPEGVCHLPIVLADPPAGAKKSKSVSQSAPSPQHKSPTKNTDSVLSNSDDD